MVTHSPALFADHVPAFLLPLTRQIRFIVCSICTATLSKYGSTPILTQTAASFSPSLVSEAPWLPAAFDSSTLNATLTLFLGKVLTIQERVGLMPLHRTTGLEDMEKLSGRLAFISSLRRTCDLFSLPTIDSTLSLGRARPVLLFRSFSERSTFRQALASFLWMYSV